MKKDVKYLKKIEKALKKARTKAWTKEVYGENINLTENFKSLK